MRLLKYKLRISFSQTVEFSLIRVTALESLFSLQVVGLSGNEVT